MWPTFTIKQVRADGSAVGCVDFVCVGESTWIGEGLSSYLKHNDCLISGRWHNSDTDWRFTPNERQEFSLGDCYTVFDHYWGERVLLAIDPSIVWSPGDWSDLNDHDHCAICWAKISAVTGTNFHRNSSDDSVCEDCYGNHVLKRDISFLPVS